MELDAADLLWEMSTHGEDAGDAGGTAGRLLRLVLPWMRTEAPGFEAAGPGWRGRGDVTSRI